MQQAVTIKADGLICSTFTSVFLLGFSVRRLFFVFTGDQLNSRAKRSLINYTFSIFSILVLILNQPTHLQLHMQCKSIDLCSSYVYISPFFIISPTILFIY